MMISTKNNCFNNEDDVAGGDVNSKLRYCFNNDDDVAGGDVNSKLRYR